MALPQVDARTLSQLGLAQGTFDYGAPEQKYGLPLDQRCDVFSLAMLAKAWLEDPEPLAREGGGVP